jgi:hypothetical protein
MAGSRLTIGGETSRVGLAEPGWLCPDQPGKLCARATGKVAAIQVAEEGGLEGGPENVGY